MSEQIKIGSFADLINEASKNPTKDDNEDFEDFDDVVELFRECGLDELLDEEEK